jgi:hypothetical protein
VVLGRSVDRLKRFFVAAINPGTVGTGTLSAMSWPSVDALDDERRRLEDLADHTPGIDPWCSGPDWFLPAHEAFADTVFDTPVIPRLWSETGTGAIILGQARVADGTTLVTGLEPLWGFASPLLGPDLVDLAELAAEHLATIDDWDVIVLGGLPLSPHLAGRLAQPLRRTGDVQATYGIVRQVADLGDGYERWFSARSARFRKSIRQGHRKAVGAGVRFVDVSTDPNAYQRCVAVETDSWKGHLEDGITSLGMHRFYEVMTDRLRREGRLRATVAVLDDRDVGFIFGGVRNGRYRGLQLSFAESVRHLSISNLLQHHTIRLLIEEGVHTYDMGMDMDYKRRWADRSEPSMSMIVRRTGSRGLR